MPAINLTAEFSLFPDNTQMGQNFSLGGYIFDDLSGTSALFVNDTANERGLQFTKSGLSITLAIPTKIVDLRIGAFAGPLKITAADAGGTTIHTQTVNTVNRYIDIRIIALQEIANLTITEGGNEGILIKIMTSLSIC